MSILTRVKVDYIIQIALKWKQLQVHKFLTFEGLLEVKCIFAHKKGCPNVPRTKLSRSGGLGVLPVGEKRLLLLP